MMEKWWTTLAENLFLQKNYALHPHATALDNIAFPLRMRKVPESGIGRNLPGELYFFCEEGAAARVENAS